MNALELGLSLCSIGKYHLAIQATGPAMANIDSCVTGHSAIEVIEPDNDRNISSPLEPEYFCRCHIIANI